MTFFHAWSQAFNEHSPIPLQTFKLHVKQGRQFIDWHANSGTLAFARSNKGQVYIVGDEPDQYCQPPADYAAWYHNAIQAVRSVDPTARFIPAGFAEPNQVCADPSTNHPSWAE